jgi:putative hydrolase of the HAD superfamily
MIRAIFFDLDGTLVDRAKAHHRYCLDLVDRRPDVFPDRQRDVDLQVLTEGADDLAWDRRTFGRRVAERFPDLGMTAGQVARDHATRLAGFVEADPRIVRLLANLASRHRLAIVSNGSGQVQRSKLARLGLGPIRAFVSGELGVSKPDRALFLTALEWADCQASEALFVGDDPARDIAGAAGVGMATCWVSGGCPYPAGLPTPDRTIHNVADLEAERVVP